MRDAVERHLMSLGMKCFYKHPVQNRTSFIPSVDESDHQIHLPLYIEFKWDAILQVTEAFARLGGMLTSRTGEPVFMLDMPIAVDRLLSLREKDIETLRYWGEKLRNERTSIYEVVGRVIKSGAV